MVPRYKTSPASAGTSCPCRTRRKAKNQVSMIYYTAWTMSAKTQAPGRVLQAAEVPLRRRRGDPAVAPGPGDPAAEERRVLEGLSRAAGHPEAQRQALSRRDRVLAHRAVPARDGVDGAGQEQDRQLDQAGAVRHARATPGRSSGCGWRSSTRRCACSEWQPMRWDLIVTRHAGAGRDAAGGPVDAGAARKARAARSGDRARRGSPSSCRG